MHALASVAATVTSNSPRTPSSGFDLDDVLELLQEGVTPRPVDDGISLHTIGIEVRSWDGLLHCGRVDALAPMDLLAELHHPLTLGELTPIRLESRLCQMQVETLGLVHWSQRSGSRFQVGLFLRESLPDALLSEYWTDMRQELRFPAQGSLWARFASAREHWKVEIHEYSRSGAKLSSPRKPQIGDRVELFDDDLIAAGTVRFVHPAAPGAPFQVGCEFPNNAGIRLARLCARNAEMLAPAYQMAITWKRDLPRDRRN